MFAAEEKEVEVGRRESRAGIERWSRAKNCLRSSSLKDPLISGFGSVDDVS